MQGVQSTRRVSPRTKASFPVSNTAMAPKAPKEDVVVDKSEPTPSGSKLSNPGSRKRSYLESNVSGKIRLMSKGIEAITELKRMPTPMNLFEDECTFCHSFRTSQIHGLMVRYLMGRIVSSDEDNPSSGIYVHMKCLEWAPQVWFEGHNIKKMESEIRRASKLRCHRCRLPGAALGCYYNRCNKTFHVPCAVQIYDCRWDFDHRHVLCPEHVSQVLPCDKLSSQTKERHQFSSLHQSQYPKKVQKCDDYQGENQETDPLKASNSSLLSQSCCPDEGISDGCQGEEMNIDQEETETPNYSSDNWVLLGSSLSASEKDSIKNFALLTKAKVTNEWGENVTHIIVGKHAGNAWYRAYEVLMAILFGKWVVQAKWIVDCLEMPPAVQVLLGIVDCLAMRPAVEDSYEVTCSDDSGKPLDGPKKGRTRAAEGTPKLFSGLYFYVSKCMNSDYRGQVLNLIEAGGGLVLTEEKSSLDWRGDSSPRLYFVYDGGVPGEFSASSLRTEMEEARKHAAAGARVISHLTVMDAIAAYDVEVLGQKRAR